jgi:hypothetical protein
MVDTLHPGELDRILFGFFLGKEEIAPVFFCNKLLCERVGLIRSRREEVSERFRREELLFQIVQGTDTLLPVPAASTSTCTLGWADPL